MKSRPIVIAVCGKGGVGKTSISALIVRKLIEQGEKRILAIDADPAVGFATALGVEVGKTVDDIRLEIIKSSKSGDHAEKMEILSKLDYEVLDAMIEREGYAFLAIGRPETEGCYCRVNDYLKTIIESLVEKFDYVVIDGEAGIEQINRRVLEKVTHLLLVSDCSKKGIHVIHTIAEVAGRSVQYDRTGVLLNMLKSPEESNLVTLENIELIGTLPEDTLLRQYDIEGKPLLEFDDNQMTQKLSEALHKFGVLES
jgi:CO dehydrogenase maturation factor